MALVLADRVRETTTTAGTGTVTLAGAVTGYQSFAAIGNGNTTYYTISNPNNSEWEVGLGTYTSSGTTLSRTTVLASSNSGALVSFSAGSKVVFCDYPAGKAIYSDANGVLTVASGGVTPSVAVTFSATAMTVNCVLSNVFTTTFTANVTTAPTISNPQDGQTINWFITQDGTGSRTMTWPTSFKWPGGTAGVLSTAASSVDLLIAVYRSSTGFWYATLQKGFA
jgi:hypothetical protein